MAATLFPASEARTTAIGLLFWIAFGAIFVRRYDKQGRDRMDPKLLPTCTRSPTITATRGRAS